MVVVVVVVVVVATVVIVIVVIVVVDTGGVVLSCLPIWLSMGCLVFAGALHRGRHSRASVRSAESFASRAALDGLQCYSCANIGCK